MKSRTNRPSSGLRRALIGAVGVASLVVSSWAQAVVLYDESVSGDLANFDPITLTLQKGANSIFGSSEFSNSATDFDGFQVLLGSGLYLTGVEYFISNVSVAGNTSSLSSGYSLRSGGHGGTNLASTTIDILGGSPQSMFGSALPLAGLLSLGVSPEFLSRSGDGGTWDYEIRLNVVPEPASLALIVMGLAGLGFTRRRAA